MDPLHMALGGGGESPAGAKAKRGGVGCLGEHGICSLHAHLQSPFPASSFEVTTEKGGGHAGL